MSGMCLKPRAFQLTIFSNIKNDMIMRKTLLSIIAMSLSIWGG